MNYFTREDLVRINYKNTFKLKDAIEQLRERRPNIYFYYDETHEYVVVWYQSKFIVQGNADNEKVYIEVVLANLTKPTYEKKNKVTGLTEIQDNYLTMEVLIDYVHKLPIGSIWLNGRSKQRFDFPRYQGIEVVEDNYQTISIARAANYEQRRENMALADGEQPIEMPFDYLEYFGGIFHYDKNQLIVINHNNQKFVIHPLLLFITHYGYSMQIKQIIARYDRNTIENKLQPSHERIVTLARQQGYDRYVLIPRRMIQRDAVFLYHYKYNEAVRRKVNRINDAIRLVRENPRENIKIDFWHLPLTLNVRGIRIGDTIFCTSITGISEPINEAITVLLEPRRNANLDAEEGNEFTRFRPYVRPQNIEEMDVDFVRDPVNNIMVEVLMERLERIGELRQLNVVRLVDDEDNPQANVQYLEQPNAENFGVGEAQGWGGATGLAQCLFKPDDLPKSHFDTVWQHAKEYAQQVGSVAYWYTPQQGLKNNLKDANGKEIYWVLELGDFDLPNYDIDPPTHAMIIWIAINNVNYYIIDFGKVKNDSWKPAKSIAYRADENEDFLHDREGLITLLMSVVAQNGSLDSDFVDKYRGKIALYIHKTGENNNWVRNGIVKVLI